MNELPDLARMTRREIEDYLIERALVDPAFRKRLLAEPEAELIRLGLPVGPDVKIRVLEEEPQSFFIVLPRVLRETEELDESALDGVAGGVGTGGDPERFFRGFL